jgi:hypothetical protein
VRRLLFFVLPIGFVAGLPSTPRTRSLVGPEAGLTATLDKVRRLMKR